jgi:hypothetical protein
LYKYTREERESREEKKIKTQSHNKNIKVLHGIRAFFSCHSICSVYLFLSVAIEITHHLPEKFPQTDILSSADCSLSTRRKE